MKVTRYVAIHDLGLNGAAIAPEMTFATEAAAYLAAEDVAELGDLRRTTGYQGFEVVALEVELAPPPLKVDTLGPADTLVLAAPGDADADAVVALCDALEVVLPGRWLVLDGVEALASSRKATSGPSAPAQGEERLPWSYYGPELTTRLKQLVERFPHRTVADAAVTLADMIDQYGPEAVAERRREK